MRRWRPLVLTLLLLLSGTAAVCFYFSNPRSDPGQFREPEFILPPDKLAKAKMLTRLEVFDYAGVTTWTGAAIIVLLNLGVFARLRDLALRATKRSWLQGFIILPVFLTMLVLLTMPFQMYAQHVRRSYGLSIQGWSSWWMDWLKQWLIQILLGTLLVSLVFATIRRSPRRWWLWIWLGSVPVVVLLTLAVPLILDPLFNHFEPLQKSHPDLVAALERVVNKGGLEIPPSRMFLMDASKKVTAINAYVTGLGPSARVVVWDNALAKATSDEVLWIFGHEMGHYVLRHIYVGILFTAVLLLAVFRAGDQISRWMIVRWSHRWDVRSQRDWAALGVYALVLTMFNYVLVPVVNTYSRSKEHEADVYSMEAMHGILPDPQASGVRTFQLLGTLGLSDPSPNPLVVLLLYSHPPIAERLRFAANYDPWAHNQAPRYFPK
jgi:STE24 endopeptidase